jgi:hypothetical protein
MLSIDKNYEEIQKMKQEPFRSFVEKKVKMGAFQYLQNLAKNTQSLSLLGTKRN